MGPEGARDPRNCQEKPWQRLRRSPTFSSEIASWSGAFTGANQPLLDTNVLNRVVHQLRLEPSLDKDVTLTLLETNNTLKVYGGIDMSAADQNLSVGGDGTVLVQTLPGTSYCCVSQCPVLIMIVLVASFNIIGTLTLLVITKGREIAILKAMGATRKNIGRIFMLEGLVIGLGGTTLGLLLGLALCFILANYQFVELPASVYYVTTLPVKVKLMDVAAICLAATVVSFIATVYPARRASMLNPVEILRYE